MTLALRARIAEGFAREAVELGAREAEADAPDWQSEPDDALVSARGVAWVCRQSGVAPRLVVGGVLQRGEAGEIAWGDWARPWLNAYAEAYRARAVQLGRDDDPDEGQP